MRMNIFFGTRKLQKEFSSRQRLVKKFGQRQAQKIAEVLKVMQVVSNLEQVPTAPPFRRHQLAGKRQGCFAVKLEQPYRLVFRPGHENIPKKDDARYDLTKITDIIIIGVEDYH